MRISKGGWTEVRCTTFAFFHLKEFLPYLKCCLGISSSWKISLFFVSSLFVKKPSRIQGLLMVMTLALLVYSVTQRRLRQQLARQGKTVPNQINQPTAWPTLRWVFQLLEGIHRVRVTVQGQLHDLIEGLHEVQIKILRLFGEEVCRLYQISPG